jgi:tetratricopeptide (TPR) repeat protein
VTIDFRHRAVRGGLRADREGVTAAMDPPPRLMDTVDAHARLRGPYTAGGAIVRAVTEALLRTDPALARRHDIEIRALVPELRDAVPLVREVLAETVPPTKRTRIYPRLRTLRLAHGVTDLLRDYLLGEGGGPRSLVIENLHYADQSDRELVAVLVRRLDPALLTIVACEAGPGPGPGTRSSPGPTGARLGSVATPSPGAATDTGSDAGPGPNASDETSGRHADTSPGARGDPLAEALAAHAVYVHLPTPDMASAPGAESWAGHGADDAAGHGAGGAAGHGAGGAAGHRAGGAAGHRAGGAAGHRAGGAAGGAAGHRAGRAAGHGAGDAAGHGAGDAAGHGAGPGADQVAGPAPGQGTTPRQGQAAAPPRPSEVAYLAARYVRGDGTSDDPLLLQAYACLGASERAVLHDARADELAASGEFSARLGAVPYHRERGSDPAGAGVRALAEAAEHCFAAGFHAAVVGLCARGRRLVTPARDPAHWWLFTSLAAGSLAALGRGAEAEALYDEARIASTDPSVHRRAAYETAMLYARHHQPSRRDQVAALPWINEAIAFARSLADRAERAFSLAFSINGRALVEMRLGNSDRALELVEEALALFDRDLPVGSHPLDRCSLLANRARLLSMRGPSAEALASLDALIALDPTYGEYHFERGNLLHLLGRDDEALAAYAEAQRLSLPFPELHYNRADLLAARGEEDAALADLDRVLELDPDFLDAYVNRAGILTARGDTAAAWPDVDAGLSRDPGNPYLLCILGQLETARGRAEAARAAFDAAVAARPGLVAAWASRAALHLEAGDPDAAVADLTRALEQGEDSSLLFNRAVAHRAAGRLEAARDDAGRSLELHPGDPEALALLAEISHSRRGR